MRHLLIAALLLAGCGRRSALIPADGGGEEPRVIREDLTFSRDLPQSCRPERVLVSRFADPSGQFTLVTAEQAQVSPVTITGAAPGEAAAVIGDRGVAGLVVVRPSTAEPGQELASLQKALAARIAAAGLGSLSVRASGILGRSHDGQPHLIGAVWDLLSPAPLQASAVRTELLCAALQRSPGAFVGLPPPSGAVSSKLVLRLSLTRRGQQLALSAALLGREQDDDPASELGIVADDLSNGTALAAAGAEPRLTCDVGAISGQPMADIIWVVDESGSMDDNRKSIVENANLFFAKAAAANLDFRMGVTGVRKPDGYAQPGKLCSREGPQADDGGDDRFLDPGEKDLFTACINNPPYFEQSFEFGLTAAYWAVKRHLPRAASPGRIRPGAKLALIIATDEVPQELKPDGSFEGKPGFLGMPDWNACTLSEEKQAKLSTFLGPLRQLFSGSDPEARAAVHLIGGVCASSCTEFIPEIAHGYRELAEELGGQVGDICQKNLGPTLQVIIDSIAASASPRVLHGTPISASLDVELNGAPLARSGERGYLYDAHTNALTFVNVKVQKGDQVVASYRSF